MSKKNPIICPAGETEDGKIAYKGVYRFYETTGVPLDILFDCIARKNAVVSWYHFYTEASAAGMEYSRILSKIEEAVCDVWGNEYMTEIKTKSKQMIEVLKKPKNVVRTFPSIIKPDKIIIIS